MRGTNAIGYRILACFIISVLLLGYLPAPAIAYSNVIDHTALHTEPASWPTSFNAYTDGNGNIITDVNGEISPTYADITSGPTIDGTNPAHGSQPSVYMNSDGTNMFFRMRVGANPVRKSKFRNTNYMIAIGTLTVTNNHWKSALAIGFNGNANGAYVYLTKDGSSITKVYNVSATDDNQGAQVVPISDGTGQYFLDFQVPISELEEFTDTNGNQFQDTTPIRLFYGTSQANNLAVINKDYMDGTSDYSSSGTITPTGLLVPTGLAASEITQTSCTLTWTATPGATSYNVFKDGTLYASPATNTAPITGLTAETTYSFTVSAVYAVGESAQSTALQVKTLSDAPAILHEIRDVEVLEVQPGTSYDLTTSYLTEIFAGHTVNLTQLSMPEFISKVDEINGKYDIVYIGNKGGAYTALGREPAKLPQGGNNGTNSMEYYSDNDITNRRANTLKDFINSKQLTIFENNILGSGSSLTNTKLYTNFIGYLNNYTYPNFITVNTSGDKNSHLKTAFSVYNNVNVAKRPFLTLNNQPVLYDGTDASYQTDKTLGYNFDINNLSNTNTMTVKLYIDINGDGIFKAEEDYAGKSEIVYKMDNLNSDTGRTINYHLPDSYVGLDPWKLELTDNATGSKSYQIGATAFKVKNSGNELKVRVLQLKPSGNTLSIYSLGQDMLVKDKVYKIDVTEMSINDFNDAYANLQTDETPSSKPAIVNGISKSAPTALNGNYDMVIMGFADIYGGNDLTNTNSLNAIRSFINTNQSVMFTHDTLTFQVKSNPSWGYNITQNFRNIVGQQRYFRTAPDSNRYYDLMPNAQKDSYGFSNLTLGRYNNGLNNDGKTFQTTTETKKVNDNLITQFPYVLGDIPVAATHFQYFQLDLEDENVVPVYNLNNNSGSTIFNHPGDGRNDYYTYSKGNITYSGTGHSAPNGLPEKQMFINTMIKASRGANHAPLLEVYGISDGMNIANSLSSIDFSFKATDTDLNEPYLNADIYLSTSNDGTTFSSYERVKQFSAVDPDIAKRVSSGVVQTVSVAKNVDDNIIAYKVKVEAYDSYGASTSQEIRLNNRMDPQITVDSFTTACLVGDTVNIPVNVSAHSTELTETFKNISNQVSVTNPSGIETHLPSAQKTFPDVIFSTGSSWDTQSHSYDVTFNEEGTYTILNSLTYTAYDGVPPIPDNIVGQERENDQTFSIQVGSGTLEVSVVDQNNKGILGATTTISGPHSRTGTTNTNGLSSFTDLSSGDYTVTVSVPTGRTIAGSTSQTISLSASNSYEEITFTMGGDLLLNPSITSRSGDVKLSTIRNIPLETNIGVDLTRPATSLNFDLTNDLIGSTSTNVAIDKLYWNNQEIHFNIDGSNPSKILPSQQNTSFPTTFPSGNYKLEATVTIVGGTMQVGQKFTVSLTKQTSATDANSESVECIALVPTSLTVNVVSLISNPSITTHSGATQMSILKNVPLQTILGFDLSRTATFLKIDLSNDFDSTMNVVVSNIKCNNQGNVQPISFTIDSDDPGIILPSNGSNAPFPSGTYTMDAIIKLDESTMLEGQSFDVTLTDQTSAQDAITNNIENIAEVSLPLNVNVGSAPKLH